MTPCMVEVIILIILLNNPTFILFLFSGLFTSDSVSKVTKVTRVCSGNVEKRITFGHISNRRHRTVMANICTGTLSFLGRGDFRVGIGEYHNMCVMIGSTKNYRVADGRQPASEKIVLIFPIHACSINIVHSCFRRGFGPVAQ